MFGEVKAARLPKKMVGSGSHRGFCFVEFHTVHEAKVRRFHVAISIPGEILKGIMGQDGNHWIEFIKRNYFCWKFFLINRTVIEK